MTFCVNGQAGTVSKRAVFVPSGAKYAGDPSVGVIVAVPIVDQAPFSNAFDCSAQFVEFWQTHDEQVRPSPLSERPCCVRELVRSNRPTVFVGELAARIRASNITRYPDAQRRSR